MQVITLDHKAYEAALLKIQESHRKSSTVRERMRLVPLAAAANGRPQSGGPHATLRRLPLEFQPQGGEEGEGNIHEHRCVRAGRVCGLWWFVGRWVLEDAYGSLLPRLYHTRTHVITPGKGSCMSA